MVTKEQIARINELYKKKIEAGLTEEEEKEQAELRKLYIAAFKQNLKSQLDNIEFVDNGNEAGKCGCGHDHSHSHDHKHGEGCGCGCGSSHGGHKH